MLNNLQKVGDFMNHLVTIVLPIYNGVKYMAHAIESCIKQTYKNIELIIVDDGSTDNSIEIAEQYMKQDNRIILKKNKKNLKLPSALNTGFKHANGYYYTWISDDNKYKHNAIEKMVAFLNHQTDISIVFSDFDLIDENGDYIKTNKTGPARDLPIVNTIGACFLFKKKVFEDLNGYDTTLFLVEDYDFWLRAYGYFNYGKLNESLYFYRHHASSLTTKRQEEILEFYHKLLIVNLARNPYIEDDIKIRVYKKLIRIFKETNSLSQARKYFLKVFLMSRKEALNCSKELLHYVAFGNSFHK